MGKERPVLVIAAERDSEKERLTDRPTDTYTEEKDQPDFCSPFQEHMFIELTCFY